MDKAKRQNKHILIGDQVMVIAGNDRGLVGKVLSRTEDRVTIQGVNVRKKCVRKSEANPQGGIIDIERPVHISNVTLCTDEEHPRKVKVKFDKSRNKLFLYKEGDAYVNYLPENKS